MFRFLPLGAGGALLTCAWMLPACYSDPASTAAPPARATAQVSIPPSPPVDPQEERRVTSFTPSSIVWQSGPRALPPGASAAMLEGDPSKEGPFALRLKLPAGYRIPPHTHTAVERVTVISGTFRLGFGTQFDTAAITPYPAGTFLYWSPGMEHFAMAEEETVIQLHGTGPWSLTYVNPADDPRNRPAEK